MEKASVRRKDWWECGAVEPQNKDIRTFLPCAAVFVAQSPCSLCFCLTLQNAAVLAVMFPAWDAGRKHPSSCCWVHLVPWGRHGEIIPKMVQIGCCGEAEPETTPLVSGHKTGAWEMEMVEKRCLIRQLETSSPVWVSWTGQ